MAHKFFAKVYHCQDEVILAACDKDVYGKTFENEVMHLEVNSAFYGEELVDYDDITLLLNSSTIANLVGAKIVKHAIEVGLVDPENIIEIEGVPHAQIARML
ncbi:MAG: DUF424 domain-containing protein [Candidatus Hydrothermarchaeales archaeon]